MGKGLKKEDLLLFGLIGFPLSHSFSKKYFNDKFLSEKLTNHFYELFPLSEINQLPQLIASNRQLTGLNVTIPYKETVIPFLDEIDSEAEEIGAVNTIRFHDGKLKGFNTDVYGFNRSLMKKVHPSTHHSALILGTGGASKAVAYALKKNQIPFRWVSRSKKSTENLNYSELNNELIASHPIIINTTPLGMYPNIDSKPELPYDAITSKHLLYDLVYNPSESAFLKAGRLRGAITMNGLEMLHLQAERAWEIWNR